MADWNVISDWFFGDIDEALDALDISGQHSRLVRRLGTPHLFQLLPHRRQPVFSLPNLFSQVVEEVLPLGQIPLDLGELFSVRFDRTLEPQHALGLSHDRCVSFSWHGLCVGFGIESVGRLFR